MKAHVGHTSGMNNSNKNLINANNTIDMLYPYNPAQAETMALTLSDGREITGEFFDGMRIDPETIPSGKHWYQTRHDDNGNWTDPVTILRGRIIVNFCGTLISDADLDLSTETDIIGVNYGE